MTLLHFPSGSTAGNTGLLKWADMAVVPPSGQPGRAKIRPLSLWLPHNSNRLFIEQRRQVGRKAGGWVGVWGSQAANIDKERGRDTVTHSRGTCTDRNIWVIVSHSGQTLSRKRDGWQRFSSHILSVSEMWVLVWSPSVPVFAHAQRWFLCMTQNSLKLPAYVVSLLHDSTVKYRQETSRKQLDGAKGCWLVSCGSQTCACGFL